ncbi:hypothetical protein IM53_000190 [Xanthomonas phaseoli pv. dieffenbachiae]|uniref:Uncharacterized protein n=1 Tax=Xanthomonas phaseoli pv. dieffenbachiae TaxID=92828 RepID=A0A1V9HG48_9XANT|nr:hypothetical protein IM53_000190 [Xanthomonas phaseoli pv. dieffenbachiae]
MVRSFSVGQHLESKLEMRSRASIHSWIAKGLLDAFYLFRVCYGSHFPINYSVTGNVLLEDDVSKFRQRLGEIVRCIGNAELKQVVTFIPIAAEMELAHLFDSITYIVRRFVDREVEEAMPQLKDQHFNI